ncbi:MAG: hypothetical protein HXN53_05620 [Prevotella nigrescens]|nr:hypothetical protein [Prevotella nigrescens]
MKTSGLAPIPMIFHAYVFDRPIRAITSVVYQHIVPSVGGFISYTTACFVLVKMITFCSIVVIL